MSKQSKKPDDELQDTDVVAVAENGDHAESEQVESPNDEIKDENPVAKDKQKTVSLQEHEALKNDLEAALKKADAQWDQAIRARAEVENIRKRAERDVENAHKFGIEKLLKEIIPVVDSLEQGLNNASETNEAVKSIREGMELTLQMLESVLAKFNVEKVNPEGQPFDPSLHEAISMLENQEVEPGTVLHVIQPGFTIHGRIVRPARVIVAKGKLDDSIDEKA